MCFSKKDMRCAEFNCLVVFIEADTNVGVILPLLGQSSTSENC